MTIDNLISGVTMTGFDIEVLRLGHRKGRDPRITTHLALVSRAMGLVVSYYQVMKMKNCFQISSQ